MDNRLSYIELYDVYLSQLRAAFPGVETDYPFALYQQLLSKRPPYLSYRVPTKESVKLCKSLLKAYSTEALDLYHRCLLLYLIVQTSQHPDYKRYTRSIEASFLIEYQRIARELATNPTGFYCYKNDLFCKDLAVCTHEMFPIGAFKTELSGLPRSILYRGGWWQFVRTFFLSVKLGKSRPTYEIHLDIRYREYFTSQKWDECFLQIAEMLEKNPEFLGFSGVSWFFDPEIRRVSPHLAYLRKLIEDNGGEFYYFEKNSYTTEVALRSSANRRKLYEQGLYEPVGYLAFWPRTRLMDWALKHKNSYFPM